MQQRVAVLDGYRRTFNKASTKNRGSKEAPCPTLNLERDLAGSCKGMAFEFPEAHAGDLLAYLAKREGKDFLLDRLTVRLEDDAELQVYVPVYHGENLVSTSTLAEKVAMVRNAAGKMSSCADYVKQIAAMLADLGIDDPAVSELWRALQQAEGVKVVRRAGDKDYI